ncbi:L,D-transpeptidase [Nocardioides caldifontis]|uniref:L,D-transpeptidase n=1 Tax=Nocardioides caldifontis TaxID=2588938 RepID=UPI0011E047B2|nr:L,D-transpeptidase [Nocardioides caldifontis]
MPAREVRLRRGRVAALGASLVVTTTAALGGLGVLPSSGEPSYAATPRDDALTLSGSASSSTTGSVAPGSTGTASASETDAVPVPADSGEGRRVVFDVSDQRVWLVREDGSVARTYLVSGSIYDNLDAGSYAVYSRSRNAIGIDDSGTMKFMVRFAHGDRAAIGFHDIPVDDGEPVQELDDLGTPMSHGCIRQARPDAKALWRFAPIGTTVVVTE